MSGLPTRRGSQRSQAMVEFALVAPVLFLVLFAILDLGRVIYTYNTLSQAAQEGARVAIEGQAPFFVEPRNTDVEAAVRQHAIDVSLAAPCPNGPIRVSSGNPPPPNQGYLYITQPIDIFAQPPSASVPGPANPNAPGAQTGANPSGCWPPYQAFGHTPLQVSIYFNFVPLTPIIRQLVANRVVLRVDAVYRTEY